jgi:hypothetical protein
MIFWFEVTDCVFAFATALLYEHRSYQRDVLQKKTRKTLTARSCTNWMHCWRDISDFHTGICHSVFAQLQPVDAPQEGAP